MSETRPATEPILAAASIGTAHLGTDRLTGSQLQRAWALGYVRLIWPTIDPISAQRLSHWITDGGKP